MQVLMVVQQQPYLAGGGGYGKLVAAPGSAAVAGGDGLGVFVDATL